MLMDLLRELCGDDARPGGACLRQMAVPPALVGSTYGALWTKLALQRRIIPLGLFRRKSENPAWRLRYVVTNPPWHERLEAHDQVFILRERGGAWLDDGV